MKRGGLEAATSGSPKNCPVEEGVAEGGQGSEADRQVYGRTASGGMRWSPPGDCCHCHLCLYCC